MYSWIAAYYMYLGLLVVNTSKAQNEAAELCVADMGGLIFGQQCVGGSTTNTDSLQN